jgi:hypothetical protein
MVVVVTWGSTSVDRSITIMDRVLRYSRRHRARCQPISTVGRDDASWVTSVIRPLKSFGSEGTNLSLFSGRSMGDRAGAVRKPASRYQRVHSRLRVDLQPLQQRREVASCGGDRFAPGSRAGLLRQSRQSSRRQGGSGRAG